MKKIISSLLILTVLLTSGCAAVGYKYIYSPTDLENWKSDKCKQRSDTAYGFNCGEATYWVCPTYEYDTSWFGLFIFPFLFPSFLLEKQNIPASFYLYADNEPARELTFQPILKTKDGKIIQPSTCSDWKPVKSREYQSSWCKYPISIWDLSSFTLQIDTKVPNCEPKPVEFIQKKDWYYFSPGLGI